MGKLVAIVGNSASGKTTLTHRLASAGQFTTGLEQHIERPFQRLFAAELAAGERPASALPNQVDYLVYRAEQELSIRQGQLAGLVDGGLDMDFHVFTRFFYQRGYLDKAGFNLCAQLYTLLRELLPPPDLILRLAVPLSLAADRHRRRARSLEIATLPDLAALESLLETWLSAAGVPVIQVDACQADPTYAAVLPQLLEDIHALG